MLSVRICRRMLSSKAVPGYPPGPGVLVEVERELVALAESRVRGDPVEDLRVRHLEVQVGALLLDQALAKHLLQRLKRTSGLSKIAGSTVC